MLILLTYIFAPSSLIFVNVLLILAVGGYFGDYVLRNDITEEVVMN